MKKKINILLASAVCCGTVFADAVWENATDGEWTVPLNWVGGTLPDASTRADFTVNGSAYTVTLNSPDEQTAKDVRIAGNVSLNRPTTLDVRSTLVLDGGNSSISNGTLDVCEGGVLDIRNGGLRLESKGILSVSGGTIYGTNGFTSIKLNSTDKINSTSSTLFEMTGGLVSLKTTTTASPPIYLNADQRYKIFSMSGGRMDITGFSDNSCYGITGYGYGNDNEYFKLSGNAQVKLSQAGLFLGWGTVDISGNAKMTVIGVDTHVFKLGPLPSDGNKKCVYNFKGNSSVCVSNVKQVIFGKADARTKGTVGILNISGGDHYFSRYNSFCEGTGTYTMDISGGRTMFGGYGVRIGGYPLQTEQLTSNNAYTNSTLVNVTGGALVFDPTESLNNSARPTLWGTVLGYGVTPRRNHSFDATMNVSGGGVVTNSFGPLYIGTGVASARLLQTGGEICKMYPTGTEDYNYCKHSLVVGFAGGNGSYTVAAGRTTCMPTVFVGGVTNHASNLKIELNTAMSSFPEGWETSSVGMLAVTNTGTFLTGWNVYVGHGGTGVLEVGDQATFTCGRNLCLTNTVPGAATLKFRLSGSQVPTFTVTKDVYISAGSRLVVDAADFTFPSGVSCVKLLSAAGRHGSFADENITILGRRNLIVLQSRNGDSKSIWLKKISGAAFIVR